MSLKSQKNFFWSGNFGAYFKRGLSLSTKYLDTFCEAQVITSELIIGPNQKCMQEINQKFRTFARKTLKKSVKILNFLKILRRLSIKTYLLIKIFDFLSQCR